MQGLSFEELLSNTRNLERILDNLKEGIIAHDLSRRIFFFNKEAENITGYRREDVLGRDCHEVFGERFCGEHCSFCGSDPLIGEYQEYTVTPPSKHGESRRVEISVIPIHIPPLRERKNDIPLLAEHFLREAGDQYDRQPLVISKDALTMMLDYDWPGNVRELQNALQFAIVRSNDRVISPSDLPLEFRERSGRLGRRGPDRKLTGDSVRSALLRTGGNKAAAARLLDVGRATLYRFLSDRPETLDGLDLPAPKRR